MARLLLQADATLRGEEGAGNLGLLCAVGCLFGAVYGASMGSFGGVLGERGWQVLFAAVKVPLLLGVTFLLSLPSFFIFNTLFGLRGDFGVVLRALLTSQAGLTVILASLAPLTLLWNVSMEGQQKAVLFNAVMFAIATAGGQVILRRGYRPLLERDPRHRSLLRFWGILYAFVGIQMGWVLRPFVGDPTRPVSFFREDSWGNAYVILFQLIQNVFVR